MSGNHFGRDQRDYIQFGTSEKRDHFQTNGSFTRLNKKDHFKNDFDPTYQEEYSGENYSGKGPKNYQRSDERIREDACEILTQNTELDASNIDVSVEDRSIVLRGEVESRYEKRLAESLVENVFGIDDVRNQLRLKKHVQGWVHGLDEIKFQESGDDYGKK